MARDAEGRTDAGASDPPVQRDGLTGRALVVAYDRLEGSRAAAHVAAAIGKGHGAMLHVVHAFNIDVGRRSAAAASLLAAADELLGPAVHEPLRLEILDELSAITGMPVEWPVHVHPGLPVGAIVSEAARRDAALVITGLRHHGVIDRVFRDETTINVIRGVSCPVLAVAPALTHAPRSALVAMDFSDGAVAAARLACTIVGGEGSLMLAHVIDTRPQPVATGYAPLPAAEIDAAFARVMGELRLPAGLKVEHIVLDASASTSAATTLLEAAVGYGAEIVAAGSRRQGFIDRMFLGSVSTELVRDGRQSVLIVPPAARSG